KVFFEKNMSSASRKYDLVIFGASGFTGQYAVEEMARVAEREASSGGGGAIKWAIAGRSEAKLKDTLKAVSGQTKMEQLKSVPIIIADVSDAASLAEMAKQTKVLVSCVGPYRFFGEPVVKACVENGTNYLDVSGEPQFLESMQLKYNDTAKANGVYIVGSCGWDSVPCEMGVQFTQQSAPGPLNSIEAFYKMIPGPHGAAVHYGTWQSAIHGFAHRGELASIRKRLFPDRLPRPKHRLTPRSLISWSRETDNWCVPFPGSDRSVVIRTERAMRDRLPDRRPLQFFPYLQVGSLFNAIVMLLLGSVFGIMASFKFTRRLLESYPRLFSLGVFSHQGPSRKQVETTSFAMTFVGVGWASAADAGSAKDGNSSDLKAPSTRTVTKLVGPEPGYVATPICLLQAAMCVLRESDKMPKKGGVLTPGSAFRDTKLIDRLKSCGLEFTKVLVDDVSQ
ncbi:hypothetical protein BOX15_Mlig028227g3, partial [Macrostomum lignano]